MDKNILKKLNVQVAEAAIRFIETEESFRTCFALARAARDLDYSELDHKTAYRIITLENSGGDFPSWWDGEFTARNKKYRLAALRDFRDAILAAQKPKISALEKKVRKAMKQLAEVQALLQEITDEYDL